MHRSPNHSQKKNAQETAWLYVLTLASYFHPEEDQSIWLKRRQGSKPVF